MSFQRLCGWKSKPLKLVSLHALTKPFLSLVVDYSSQTVRARKPHRTCVMANWNMIDPGDCFVSYTIRFIDSSGKVFFKFQKMDIDKYFKCGIPESVNITTVELEMHSFGSNTTIRTTVVEAPAKGNVLHTQIQFFKVCFLCRIGD